MKTNIAKSILAASMAFAASAASAVVITGGVQGVAGPAGLNGAFYYVGAGSTNLRIADTLAVLATSTQSGSFTTTAVEYYGGDWSDIRDFLGADGGSYTGLSGAWTMSDGILRMTGYLRITAPTTINFAYFHDDAGQLTIGNQLLTSGDCCREDYASATFTSAGFYAVDIVYANTYYGGEGGATATLKDENGNVISGFFQSVVPEPATWAMLVLGFGMVGTAVRRRKPASAAA